MKLWKENFDFPSKTHTTGMMHMYTLIWNRLAPDKNHTYDAYSHMNIAYLVILFLFL